MRIRHLFCVFLLLIPGLVSADDYEKFVPRDPTELLKMVDSYEVTRRLLRLETTLPELADRLETSEPQTANDIWLKYYVSLRLGRDETAAEALPALYEIMQAYLRENPDRRQFCNEAILRPLYPLKGERLKLFIEYCERCDRLYCPFEMQSKVDALHAFWGPEKLGPWLKERTENAFRDPVEIPNSLSWVQIPMYEWQRVYMLYLAHRMPKELLEEWDHLAEDAKSNPDDLSKTARLLHAVYAVESSHRGHRLPDLDWLDDVAKKCPALTAWSFANNLSRLSLADKEERFLHRAMETPLTSDECERFRRILRSRSSMVQPARSDDLIQKIFFAENSDLLNRLLLKLDRAEEAQELMLKTRAFRKEHGLPDNIMLAGMTQSASGARVVDREILDKEPLDENDPQYWRERAEYYLGRNENAPREEALRRGLELLISMTVSQTEKAPAWNYNIFTSPLFRLLFDENRHDDIVELFEHVYDISEESPFLRSELYLASTGILLEIDRADVYYPRLLADIRRSAEWYRKNRDLPVHELYNNGQVPELGSLLRAWFSPFYPSLHSSESHMAAMRRLAQLIHETEDDVFWDALETNDTRYQETLLRLLIFPGYNHPNDDISSRFREAAFRKAESLAAEKDAYFHRSLGLILLRSKPELAVPFLEYAIENLDRDNYNTISSLVSAYLASKQGWTKIEQMILDEKNLDVQYCLKEAANVAEEAGDTESAERMRKRLANVEPWLQ